MKDIINKNKIFQYHGYQECYGDNNEIIHRGNWRNNKMNGYIEWYGIKETEFHIK
jgi:hypothetical protein